MRSQLANAIKESLLFAPDPAGVLLGVHAGIKRHRKRQRRLRAISAVAAAVIAAVSSTVAIVALHSDAPTVGGQIQGTERPSTIQVGWLPDGLQLTGNSSSAIAERLGFGSRREVEISVDNIDRTPRTAPSPSDHPIEVGGHPGFELTTGKESDIVWQLPSGRWAQLELRATSYLGPDLRAVAIRIAESVREAGGSIRTGFVATYLPANQHVLEVSTNTAEPAGFGTVTTASGVPVVDTGKPESTPAPGTALGKPIKVGGGVRIWLTTQAPKAPWMEIAQIADIQGKTAYRQSDSIVVSDFHGGWLSVSATETGLNGNASSMPESELIKVAEGVRWVG